MMDFKNTAKVFPWGHERRFNAYSNYFRKKFGARVQKVSIDAGFTCRYSRYLTSPQQMALASFRTFYRASP